MHERMKRERGQSIIEFAGLVPILIIAILLCLQAFITMVTYERAHNAARTAARIATTESYSEGRTAGWEALPAWLAGNGGAPCGGQTCVDVYSPPQGGTAGRVRTEIPLLFPGAPLVFPIEQTVVMPG